MIGLTFSSSITPPLLGVAAGLAMLAGGGEILVSGAAGLARRLGMSTLLIGLTVIAFGTSLPELFVSLTAALQNHPDIMIGNVVGSNIANVALILGISALLVPLRIRLRMVRIELILVLVASLLLVPACLFGTFPRTLGIVFVLTLVCYTGIACKQNLATENNQNQETDDSNASLLLIIGMIIGGLILLTIGSDVFIRGAVGVARHFGVSELIIGLTLAAVGTSLPELASSFSALRRKETEMVIGNVIGSNMFNLYMVLGLTAVIKPFSLSTDLLSRDLPVMLAYIVILFPVLFFNQGANRWHGFLFLTGYAVYLFFLL